AQNANYYPPELELLKGTKLLFKVEKSSGGGVPFNGSFRVKRICSDVSIMEAFDSALVKGYSSSKDDVSVEEEFVESVQDAD
ncbi:replication factor A protein, partial [Trifolium medium]|nr:replication factor A protein [Trifolium medium]